MTYLKIYNIHIYLFIWANLFVAGGDNHQTEWANRTARSRFHVISAKHGEIQRKFKTKTKNEKSRIAQDFA